MTADTKRIMDALAIAGATHRGKLELDSADCMELLGEVRRTQLNDGILTKSRDEALRDLASEQKRGIAYECEAEKRIAELESRVKYLSAFERMVNESFDGQPWANDLPVQQQLDGVTARISDLESDLAAARKALEPFAAKYSRVNRMYKGDGCERFDESYQSYQVRLGDLRAAARSAQAVEKPKTCGDCIHRDGRAMVCGLLGDCYSYPASYPGCNAFQPRAAQSEGWKEVQP